jgi:hypothetical protein
MGGEDDLDKFFRLIEEVGRFPGNRPAGHHVLMEDTMSRRITPGL